MKNRKAQTLERAQAESYSAKFEALFTEHWARVYRQLYRIVGGPAEAEDLVLETFFRLSQRYPPADEDFNFGGWLHRVATNLGLDSIRGFKRREHYELSAGKNALDESAENRPAELAAQAEERRLVRAALAQMNQRQAQLLLLRHSGLSYTEIADTLQLAPTSIGPLLLRAEREFEMRYLELTQEAS